MPSTPIPGPLPPSAAAVICLAAMLGLVYMLWRSLGPGPFMPLPTPEPAGPEPTPAEEQRRKPRCRGTPTPVRVRIAPGSTLRAWVVDRSEDGLGLQMSGPLAAEALILLRPARAPWGTGWVDAEVRHCRQLSPGHWHVGVRFLGPQPQDSLRLFA
jgi:hypothetical protein